jgi:hypothetical protein
MFHKLKYIIFSNHVQLKEKGKRMVQCTQFKAKLRLHIISKAITHKVSLILIFFRLHIEVTWVSKIK